MPNFAAQISVDSQQEKRRATTNTNVSFTHATPATTTVTTSNVNTSSNNNNNFVLNIVPAPGRITAGQPQQPTKDVRIVKQAKYGAIPQQQPTIGKTTTLMAKTAIEQPQTIPESETEDEDERFDYICINTRNWTE
jgi:hypothetical protein